VRIASELNHNQSKKPLNTILKRSPRNYSDDSYNEVSLVTNTVKVTNVKISTEKTVILNNKMTTNVRRKDLETNSGVPKQELLTPNST